MKDATGRIIEVGDEVIIAEKVGTRGYAVFGQVVKITNKMVELRNVRTGDWSGYRYPGSVIVVPEGTHEFARDRQGEEA